ncbi:MAG: NfeD family protein [Waddliaceae bacterium]
MIRLLSILLFSFSALLAEESTQIKLHGFLDSSTLQAAQANVQALKNGDNLVIHLQSESGELDPIFDLVKEIYGKKRQQQIKVTVYIDDEAIGPAAIIPFLADELYTSYFVSWGDIQAGLTVTSENLLLSRVLSLISPNRPDREKWETLAREMVTDAALLNQNQLQEQGFIQGVLSPEQFFNRYEGQVAKEPLKESLPGRFNEHIKFTEEGPNRIGLITIDDRKTGISSATWIYVKSALEYYKKNPPIFIVLKLNTPGGEVFSAQNISNALKEFDTQHNIPIVAYIDNWAISAGAMLAYSSRYITTVKDGSMGAAEPVQAGKEGKMEAASEKVNSALRADFGNRAAFFDRNSNIAMAMVDKDIILVERKGRILKLDNDEQIQPNDTVISSKGKLLTLSASQMLEYGVADLIVQPAKTGFITEQERNLGKWPADKNQLFHAPFFKDIPNAQFDEYQMDIRTWFFVILTNPVVSSVLFLGMLMGFYIEFNSPGFGIPGSLGLLCLFLMILSSFALDIANWLEVILLLVGIVFIVLDLFLIPTFGLLGISGVILFIVGLFAILLPGIASVNFEFDTQTFNPAGEVFISRLAWFSGTLLVGFGLIALLASYITPNLAGLRRFTLVGNEQLASKGYYAGYEPDQLPKPGSKGSVISSLRPSGKVEIDGKIYDAVTYSGFIDRGQSIVVNRLDGSVIVVDTDAEEIK